MRYANFLPLFAAPFNIIFFTINAFNSPSPDLRSGRLNRCTRPLLSPPPAGLRDAAVSLYDRNATWLQYAERAWTLMPRNGISPARPSRGGLVGQYSAFGSWELAQDQALILSTAPSEADYQGIELGNLWFVSLDYETRTSSLTLDQMHCSGDGRCYAVVSHRDPGIQNWLDTDQHALAGAGRRSARGTAARRQTGPLQ